MDEQPTLPGDVRVSLPLVVQAYLAYQEAQIALLREQIGALDNVPGDGVKGEAA